MSIGLLPGTTIETDLSKPDAAERMLSPMFMAGGLVLSQVSQLTGLESHVIQNWVKRGFVSSPVAKKYSRRQFCRIVIINFLKDSFQLDRIVKMLQYINGSLSSEEDDLVDDYTLYGYFVKAVCKSGQAAFQGADALREIVAEAARAYPDNNPIAKRRLGEVLQIMLVAYASARLKNTAERMLGALDQI